MTLASQANLRALVNDLAQRPECADLLKKFADELGAGGDLDVTESGKTFIESVFDNVKTFEINDAAAGSGARTDGDVVWLRDYSTLPKAHQNALYAKYSLQELVHNFKKGNHTFSDARLDRAARSILSGMDSAVASKIRSDFKAMAGKDSTDGRLAHYLINQYCQYSQQEVDNGQPQE